MSLFGGVANREPEERRGDERGRARQTFCLQGTSGGAVAQAQRQVALDARPHPPVVGMEKHGLQDGCRFLGLGRTLD